MEKLNIIKTAARLIKNDIKLMEPSNESYPVIDTNINAQTDFLPLSLKLFLQAILVDRETGDRKGKTEEED